MNWFRALFAGALTQALSLIAADAASVVSGAPIHLPAADSEANGGLDVSLISSSVPGNRQVHASVPATLKDVSLAVSHGGGVDSAMYQPEVSKEQLSAASALMRHVGSDALEGKLDGRNIETPHETGMLGNKVVEYEKVAGECRSSDGAEPQGYVCQMSCHNLQDCNEQCRNFADYASKYTWGYTYKALAPSECRVLGYISNLEKVTNPAFKGKCRPGEQPPMVGKDISRGLNSMGKATTQTWWWCYKVKNSDGARNSEWKNSARASVVSAISSALLAVNTVLNL